MSKHVSNQAKKHLNIKADKPASDCPCQSGLTFEQCCQRFITSASLPTTAEQLMCSRYTAYTLKNSEYLLRSWHPDFRPADIDFTQQQHQWIGLKIIARFKKIAGQWLYLEAVH